MKEDEKKKKHSPVIIFPSHILTVLEPRGSWAQAVRLLRRGGGGEAAGPRWRTAGGRTAWGAGEWLFLRCLLWGWLACSGAGPVLYITLAFLILGLGHTNFSILIRVSWLSGVEFKGSVTGLTREGLQMLFTPSFRQEWWDIVEYHDTWTKTRTNLVGSYKHKCNV